MAKDNQEPSLFGDLDQFTRWHSEWRGMPEFVQEDLGPFKSVIVHFESRADLDAFSKLVGQKLTENTRSIWYPAAEIGRYANKRYADAEEGGAR